MKGQLIVLLCIMVYVKGDEVSEVIANAKNHNYRFVIFSVKGAMTLSVEAKGNRDESLADLIKKLPDNLPRYVLLDYEGNSQADGSKQQNWFVIAWVPETANVMEKMMYGTTLESFKSRFEDLKHFYTLSDDKLELEAYVTSDYLQPSFTIE